MTLCIAWKNGNNISFASDSRVSTDVDSYADVGIKVMDISVKINNPISQETGNVKTAYSYTLGMCYCGDTVNAHLIKETINDVLQRLQVHPFSEDFSLRGICRVIEKFVTNTSNALRSGIGSNPDIEFLIGGYCPKEQEVLVYKFQLVDYHDHYEVMVDEVLTEEEDLILLGSGTDRAEEIIEDGNITSGNGLLKVLKNVCLDDNEPSVGGFLQYGHFETDNNFKIFGVADYHIDEDNQLEYLYPYRGTLLHSKEFETSEQSLHIAQSFIMPFEDDINEYWRQQGIDT